MSAHAPRSGFADLSRLLQNPATEALFRPELLPRTLALFSAFESKWSERLAAKMATLEGLEADASPAEAVAFFLELLAPERQNLQKSTPFWLFLIETAGDPLDARVMPERAVALARFAGLAFSKADETVCAAPEAVAVVRELWKNRRFQTSKMARSASHFFEKIGPHLELLELKTAMFWIDHLARPEKTAARFGPELAESALEFLVAARAAWAEKPRETAFSSLNLEHWFLAWLWQRRFWLADFWLENDLPTDNCGNVRAAVKRLEGLPIVRLFGWVPPVLHDKIFEKGAFELLQHIASGRSLRDFEGFALPMTTRMAHFFGEAPRKMSILDAEKFALVRSLGGSAALFGQLPTVQPARMAELMGFWRSAIGFLAAHETEIPQAQWRPLFDFFQNRRAQNPAFSFKNRTSASVLRAMEDWHRELALARTPFFEWKSLGSGPFELPTEAGTALKIEELTNSHQLTLEGRELRHCVGSYAQNCVNGACAIWSLRRVGEGEKMGQRLVTVEIRNQKIVQARGLFNRLPDAAEAAFLKSWGQKTGLAIERF